MNRILLFLILLPIFSFGQTIQTLTTPGSGTFTVPCDVTSITVEVWGAGGAGGGSSSNNSKGGGGGAGGSYVSSVLSVTPGQIINYNVGAGPTGARSAGTTGEGSWIVNNTTVYAQGGAGGSAPNNGTVSGGVGSNSSSFGNIKIAGTSGNNGTTTVGGKGGNGGNSGGNGGAAITSGANGNSGNQPGGGGGGAFVPDNTNRNGGDGGNGQINITYTSSLKTYCIPSYNNNVEPITNVTFAGINNTTTSSLGGASLEIFCSPSASVVQGSSTNTISVKGNTDGNFTESIKVYVDWDQNGVFGNNANEKYDLGIITNSTGVDAKFVSGNITVPSTAILGTTMMRVVKTYNNNGSNSNDPCFSGADWGQAEDYKVTVTAPCPTYSLTNVTATDACASPGTSTVTLTGTATGLPVGTYTVEYRLSYNSYSTVYTEPMTVSTAGSGVFTANVSIVNVSSSTMIRIDKLTLGSCTSNISSNNLSNVSYKRVTLGKPGINSGYAACSIWKAQWNNESSDGYYLDVATTNTFTAGTFLSGYNNLPIIGYPSSYDITGLTPGNTYYYRVRSYNYCGTSVNSNVITFVAGGALAPTISSITQPTCSINTGSFTITNYNSSYTYTFSPSAGVSRSGATVTASSGNFTISTSYSGCTSANTSFMINAVPSGLSAPAIGTITHPTCSTATGSFSITNYDSTYTYNFSPSAGVSRSGATVTAVTGTYTVSASLSGCTSTTTGFVINAQPTLSSVPTTISAPTTICVGSSTSLTISGGTLGSGAIVNWYSGSCGGTLVGSGNTISVSPTITTTYYVRYEGSCNSTSCISTTVTVNPSLSNNSLSLSSGTSGQVSATAAEGGNALLTAPLGTYFSNVAFASYGTPGGTSPNFTIGSCHATSSQSVTEGYLLGNNSATIPATNGVFGDPCVGTVKKVYILASYIEPICNGSKATLTGSIPSGGTGTYAYLWESSTTSATTGFSAATGTNNTINYTTGSITQTTWFRRTVTSCTLSSTSAVVMIKVNGTNSWNGTVWSSGIAPTLSDKIIFAGDYSVDADVNGCSCTVSGSKNVVIKTGRTMKIVNEVTVLGSGKLTFENSASLVQVNDASVNTGTINYIRNTSSVINSDYTYWSSPVTGQNLNISPSYSSGLAYSYNDFATPENWAGEQFSAIMQPGKGYIINGNQGFSSSPPSVYQATFVGVPNNGKIVLPIGPTGTSNLVGNPYPSAINGALFLSGNNLNIEGTIYIWTHNTAIQLASNISNGTAGSGAYAYTSDDYASYNGTGAVATSGGTVPTGNIAAGQSFFTTSLGTNPVTFSNSMRLSGTTIADGSGINQQFFKIKNAKYETEKPIEKDRVWLNLTNTQGAFKQTLIGYITDATNEYDSAFDGESFDSNEYLDFYSINQDKNLVIQGRALPFDVKDEVPLGYSSTIVGDFEIAIGQVDGALVDKEVFLEDKLLNTTHNLKNSPYLFKTEDGIFNERFILSYSNKTLATDDFENLKYGVVISNKNKEIQIKSSDDLIDKIFVYDFSGKQLYKKIKVDNIEYTIPNLGPTDQALIVKVVLQNGQTVNKKIVY